MKEGFLCGAIWTETELKARDKGLSASAEDLVVGCERCIQEFWIQVIKGRGVDN